MRQLQDVRRYLILFQLLLLQAGHGNPNRIDDQRDDRALFDNEGQRLLQSL